MKSIEKYLNESIESEDGKMGLEEAQPIVNQIKTILQKVLPKQAWTLVRPRKAFYGGYGIMIAMATSDHDINNVSGQKPDVVSLYLDLDSMELTTQVFGGNGGGFFHVEPDKNNPKEKYLAMAPRKVPFRKPKKEMKFVMKAIEKFAQNWLKVLKDNRDVLLYDKYVDYNKFLK